MKRKAYNYVDPAGENKNVSHGFIEEGDSSGIILAICFLIVSVCLFFNSLVWVIYGICLKDAFAAACFVVAFIGFVVAMLYLVLGIQILRNHRVHS